MKPDERALLLAVAAGDQPRDAGARLGIHHRRVDYLCEKWTGKGLYDWGVSVDTGWLTDAGRARAEQLRTQT